MKSLNKLIISVIAIVLALPIIAQEQYLHLYNGKSYVLSSIDSITIEEESNNYHMYLFNNGNKHDVGVINNLNEFKVGEAPEDPDNSFRAIDLDWKPIGTGTYIDNFFFYNKYEVEFEQNVTNPNRYRIYRPYLPGLLNTGSEGYTADYYDINKMDDYLEFRVLRAGEKFRDVNITNDGLVVWDIYNTGFIHPNYNDYINITSPTAFTNFADESQIAKSCVKQWQNNGLPAQIQLAPYYYMITIGGAFNYTTADNQILITFPGVIIKDYSVELEYLKQHSDENGTDYADLNVTMGQDVAYVKVGIIAQSNETDGMELYEGILNDSTYTVKLTASGVASFALDTEGIYTAMAIAYDDNDVPQGGAYTIAFEYKKPSSNDGSWKSLGMAQYTDDYIASLFGAIEALTYNVEIQENKDTLGLYRLVNPYGAVYPYNEDGDWDKTKDYYLEINATDPQGVYIKTQELGFDWGYGMFSASSLAEYHMENGYTFEEVKANGLCGTLVDGVITFPTQTLIITATDLGNWYYANINSAFKVVLPSAASNASKSVKAVVNKVNVNKMNITGSQLRKFDLNLLKQTELKK